LRLASNSDAISPLLYAPLLMGCSIERHLPLPNDLQQNWQQNESNRTPQCVGTSKLGRASPSSVQLIYACAGAKSLATKSAPDAHSGKMMALV
jgi:hypothetical protein